MLKMHPYSSRIGVILLFLHSFVEYQKETLITYIDDESTFLKMVYEISQCQTVFENVLHESKLFNPFDINEEENDITEYHGDLDPNKCYYNQFPHNLIKKIATTLWKIFQQISKLPSYSSQCIFLASFEYQECTSQLHIFSVLHQ